MVGFTIRGRVEISVGGRAGFRIEIGSLELESELGLWFLL